MVAGRPNVDYPAASTALSVLPLGRDEALTSRVRRETADHLHVSAPRNGVGAAVPLVEGDLLELSWQADDGLRSVPASPVALTDDLTWRLRVTGPASCVQRREAVRAPIGLPVSVSWDGVTLTGSTIDLSEGGLSCVLRPHGELGTAIPLPRRGRTLFCRLDLYSDELVTEVTLNRRRRREDSLHQWSVHFVDLPEPAADLVRSHVFTALRNARARRLSTLY
jgi:hypothetical protein